MKSMKSTHKMTTTRKKKRAHTAHRMHEWSNMSVTKTVEFMSNLIRCVFFPSFYFFSPFSNCNQNLRHIALTTAHRKCGWIVFFSLIFFISFHFICFYNNVKYFFYINDSSSSYWQITLPVYKISTISSYKKKKKRILIWCARTTNANRTKTWRKNLSSLCEFSECIIVYARIWFLIKIFDVIPFGICLLSYSPV